MIPLSTLLATIDVADREYWLGRCEGFHVRSAGRRFGVVEFVQYGADPSLPHTIHVRTGTRRISEITIPVADVEGLDPRRQTIWVRTQASSPARHWRRMTAWFHSTGARARTVQRATPGGA
jgi:hypothetical protein